MKRRGWWLAGVLVLLTNLVVLLGAAWNRSGEPEAVIELTERELPFSHPREEDSGRSLLLRFGGARYNDWLDRPTLEGLGFDLAAPTTGKDAGPYARSLLPRRGFVVLELDGDARSRWLEQIQRELEETRAKLERGEARPAELQDNQNRWNRALSSNTRLFPVDAGLDPAELRRRYPKRDHFLVLPAIFNLHLYWPWNEETGEAEPVKIMGYTARVLVRKVHVHRGLAERLESFVEDRPPWLDQIVTMAAPDLGPRYTVTLRVGRRHEPWIERVDPIE